MKRLGVSDMERLSLMAWCLVDIIASCHELCMSSRCSVSEMFL